MLHNREQILHLLQHNIKQAQQHMKKICGSKKNQAGIEGGSGGVPEAPAVPLNHRSPSTGLKALSSVLWAVSGAPTSGALTKTASRRRTGVLQPEPVEVLDCRSRPKNNRALVEILVRWDWQTADDATWEEYHRLKDA
jgi:hypothetical protein